MDENIKKYRNKHKKCKWCKYCKYVSPPHLEVCYFECTLKDKIIGENMKRFCKYFILKEEKKIEL